MVFIEHFRHPSARLQALALLVILLGGCGHLPTDKGDAQTGQTTAASPIDASTTETGLSVKTQNPYDQLKPKVAPHISRQFQLGIEAMQSGRNDEALSIFQNLRSSRLAGPWVNIGILHNLAGKQDEAEQAWRRAIEINPLSFDAYNELAVLKRRQGDFESARTLYLQALSYWPDNPDIQCNLGILYDLYLGELALALQAYQHCYQLDSIDPSGQQLQGWIADVQRRLNSQINQYSQQTNGPHE